MLGCKTLNSAEIPAFSCHSLQKWHSSSRHQPPTKKKRAPKKKKGRQKKLHPQETLIASRVRHLLCVLGEGPGFLWHCVQAANDWLTLAWDASIHVLKAAEDVARLELLSCKAAVLRWVSFTGTRAPSDARSVVTVNSVYGKRRTAGRRLLIRLKPLLFVSQTGVLSSRCPARPAASMSASFARCALSRRPIRLLTSLRSMESRRR